LKQSYVLDTGVLLNLVRGKELGTRIDREFALTSSMRLHTVSIVTHGELKVLAERNDWGAEKRNALAVALDNLVTLNIESEALVEAYVQVDRACRKSDGGSRTLSQNDMWIHSVMYRLQSGSVYRRIVISPTGVSRSTSMTSFTS
jgi:predicted nucleic acid-binding protein